MSAIFLKSTLSLTASGANILKTLLSGNSLKARPALPSLLSLGGTILPFSLIAIVFEPWLVPQYGLSAEFSLFLVTLAIVSIVLVVLPTSFSTLLLWDKSRHTTWGILLVVWHTAVIMLASVVVTNLPGFIVSISPWFTAAMLTPLLGLAGGLWGMSWKQP